MTIRWAYAMAAAVTFIVEVVIAIYVHDFVRPHVGDSLAVFLVYFALRAVTPLSVRSSIIAALLVACAIQFGQFYGVLSYLRLEQNRLARIVLGTGFDPRDFLAYGVGGLIAWAIEKRTAICT